MGWRFGVVGGGRHGGRRRVGGRNGEGDRYDGDIDGGDVTAGPAQVFDSRWLDSASMSRVRRRATAMGNQCYGGGRTFESMGG